MRYVTTILFIVLIAFIACDPAIDVNRTGDKLSGYVTHIDSTLFMQGGFYSISIYNADSTNPFNRVPVRTDSLNLKRRDWIWETTYDMNNIAPGRYYIAATWSKFPRVQNEIPIVLGTYGCDTSYSCIDYKIVEYPNYQGQFRNIKAWTNPAKRLF
ncbi:MAG: hypothetical protein IT280_09490 [Ignavibacteria bacterium]|nr:hypothetical protein [Ignavibacteria bacterium]